MEKKIRSISITQFDYIIRNVNDEELDIQGHPHHFTEFDNEGKPLKEIRYNRQGDFEDMFTYGYDAKGNLVRESYFPEENELAEETQFERNESGQVIRALKNYQDGSVDTTTFEYNESKKLVKKITTTDDGEVDQTETFEWDEGTLVKHEIMDGEGEPVLHPDEDFPQPNQTRLTHNDKEQVVCEEELDENGDVYMTVNRTYDNDDRADEVEVFIDGRGRSISRHYFLKYSYTFFE